MDHDSNKPQPEQPLSQLPKSSDGADDESRTQPHCERCGTALTAAPRCPRCGAPRCVSCGLE